MNARLGQCPPDWTTLAFTVPNNNYFTPILQNDRDIIIQRSNYFNDNKLTSHGIASTTL